MRALFIGLSLLAVVGPSACTPKVAEKAGAVAKTAPTRVIRFGSGGGFTGAVTTYALTNDGVFTRRASAPRDTAESVVRLPSPSAEEVIQSFRKFDALPPDSLQFEQPGNIYYFLNGRTLAGRPVQLTWGYPGATISPAARALYYELMALAPHG